MSEEILSEMHKITRRNAPRKIYRTDLTLPHTVTEAAVRHARDLKIPQVEYFRLSVAAYFKHCLLEPPKPLITKCDYCGARLNDMRTSWKRLRLSTRLDSQTRTFIGSLADDYFARNWSRAFEASVRFFLGDRNPPPDGFGNLPGVKLKPGRKTEDNPPIKKPRGRPPSSVEGIIRKIKKEEAP